MSNFFEVLYHDFDMFDPKDRKMTLFSLDQVSRLGYRKCFEIPVTDHEKHQQKLKHFHLNPTCSVYMIVNNIDMTRINRAPGESWSSKVDLIQQNRSHFELLKYVQNCYTKLMQLISCFPM